MRATPALAGLLTAALACGGGPAASVLEHGGRWESGYGEAARAALRTKVRPLAAGAEERFRASFLRDETPAFATHRVRVIETPAAR